MLDIRSAKRRALESKLGKLLQDYQDTLSQSASALAAADRNRLDRQAEDLWKQIEALERQLKELELTLAEDPAEVAKPDPGPLQCELRAKLPEIDFRALERALRKILDTHRDDGCAALLLFQQSAKMGGEWCAARIRKLLERETCVGCFRHIPLEFQPGEPVDNMALLRRLGHDLGLDAPVDGPEAFAQRVVEKLCGSLQMGSVILMEFRRCDYLAYVPSVLPWMIEQFWQHLVRELTTVAQTYSGVKIIALVFVDAALPTDIFPAELYCTLDRFEKHRLLEITLCPWSRDEIRDWITRYSSLKLLRSQVNHMADTVYKAADGLPTVVAQQILRLCAPI